MKKLLLFILLIIIKQTNAQIIETIAGNGDCCGGVDDIPATTSALYYPNAVAVDRAGNIFISESNKIRKVDLSEIITTYGGSFGGYSGDGGLATDALLESYGVAVDAVGNVYTSDWFHCVIRKIDTNGIISTIAGTGANGYGGDGGLAIDAQFNEPCGLAFDAAGNLYIADSNNHRIRKINSAGIIITVAGTGTDGFSGDGGLAIAAKLYSPIGVSLDAGGNLYIADRQNNRIRKVNTSGIISTIAGTGTHGFNGDGGLATIAEIKQPSGLACDNLGNLFVADVENLRIRMINSTGIINTIAGNGIYGFGGDGGPSIDGQFKDPWGISTDVSGNLYVADINNHRIRKISNITGVFQLKGSDNQFTLYPNPTNGIFNIAVSNSSKNTFIEVYNSIGTLVSQKYTNENNTIDLSNQSNGLYFVKVTSDNKTSTQKIIKQ